jgi:hypothetical protein
MKPSLVREDEGSVRHVCGCCDLEAGVCPEKSTRGQRKHSFEANVDLAYIFHLFQFSRYIREPLQKSRYGSRPKKRFGLTNSASNILARPTGAAAPIGPVLYHHTYIGPVLVIPPPRIHWSSPGDFRVSIICMTLHYAQLCQTQLITLRVQHRFDDEVKEMLMVLSPPK